MVTCEICKATFGSTVACFQHQRLDHCQQDNRKEPEPQLRHIVLWVCDLCIQGVGTQCNYPGCAFCRLSPPPNGIPREQYGLAAEIAKMTVDSLRPKIAALNAEAISLSSALDNLCSP